MNGQHNNRDAEAKRILDRVTNPLDKNIAPEGSDPNDWPEYWGKRIGRTLGFVFLFVVIYWLYELVTKTG